jgi:pimeloyl-ACP methyl ester carboxylesterase
MAHSQDDEQPASQFPNWKLPTLGGKQVWTDHLWRQGWRVQQNALTGHWRLLDENNVRFAWGSRAACDAVLEQQALDEQIAGGQVIVLLHGLMRSSSSMNGLAQSLSQALERPIINFEYASTRGSISAHAAALRELIAGLPADVRLSLVGHSMGNIVVRHALGDWQRADDQQTLARVDRVVMLGPPNQGAAIARQLAKTGIFGWVTGQGGMELGPNWTDFEANLAIPPCPFGIVAGRLPDSNLQNPLVEGASDFVVSVAETHLPGESDFLEVPRLHSFLMDDPLVQQAVANFIAHQRFNQLAPPQ